MAAEVLRLQICNKVFGVVRALSHRPRSRLREGEVVALLGDNGAGKSTLIKAISGVHPLDPARSMSAAQPVSHPLDARRHRLGIETIHQDTSLARDLSIARNLFLGREPVQLPFLGDLRAARPRRIAAGDAAPLLRVGIAKRLDAEAPVSHPFRRRAPSRSRFRGRCNSPPS